MAAKLVSGAVLVAGGGQILSGRRQVRGGRTDGLCSLRPRDGGAWRRGSRRHAGRWAAGGEPRAERLTGAAVSAAAPLWLMRAFERQLAGADLPSTTLSIRALLIQCAAAAAAAAAARRQNECGSVVQRGRNRPPVNRRQERAAPWNTNAVSPPSLRD